MKKTIIIIILAIKIPQIYLHLKVPCQLQALAYFVKAKLEKKNYKKTTAHIGCKACEKVSSAALQAISHAAPIHAIRF